MDGGAQSSASPVYQYFVQTAKNLKPEYISLITPSRWFAGGKGLDAFREEMLNDQHLTEIHDWLTPEDIFPNTNIRGGVNYFLWDKNYTGKNVRFVSHRAGTKISDVIRPLKVDGIDILVRDSIGMKVLEKIYSNSNKSVYAMDQIVSPRKPFGISGNFTADERFKNKPDTLKNPVTCYARGWKKGYIDRDI